MDSTTSNASIESVELLGSLSDLYSPVPVPSMWMRNILYRSSFGRILMGVDRDGPVIFSEGPSIVVLTSRLKELNDFERLAGLWFEGMAYGTSLDSFVEAEIDLEDLDKFENETVSLFDNPLGLDDDMEL